MFQQRSGRFGLVHLRSAVVLLAAALPPGVTAQDGQHVRAEHNQSNGDDPRLANAAAQPLAETAGHDTQEALCLMVESAARTNDLPLEFFARVIWQESRFQSQAIGPVTRSGKRAQGIAQFMPGTAKERGLLDPFNPVQALPKAAEFLAELRNQFGNLGLAAAAYNAGARRVQDWLAGTGPMPEETRNYVLAITGNEIEKWAKVGTAEAPNRESKTNCRDLITSLQVEPSRFVSRLKERVARDITKPWGVQVASGFNRDEALTMYSRAIKRFDTIQQENPALQPILFHVRGTSSFYQVRIGTNTRREAEALCKRIRLTHGACLVKRRRA